MDTCQICFLEVPQDTIKQTEHARFHKRFGHHTPYCVLIMNPNNQCNCPMQYVYA